MLWFFFPYALEYKIYSQKLYHIKYLHIHNCFRFYTQMRVEKKNKAFAYRIYSHCTQQCVATENYRARQISFRCWHVHEVKDPPLYGNRFGHNHSCSQAVQRASVYIVSRVVCFQSVAKFRCLDRLASN